MAQPVHLKTPHNDLVLVRFDEFSQGKPFVVYRLWRKPADTTGGGPTILSLMAPSDNEAEEFTAAWYNKSRFPITPYRHAWYQYIADQANQLERKWHGLPGNTDPIEMDQTLEEYMSADRFENMLLNAFVGRWTDDPDRDALR